MISPNPPMDPIVYFLTHSFALHATLGVVACMLGLAGGWWYWGRFEAQSLLLQSELQQQRDKLQKAGREKDDLARARDDLQAGLAACQADKARFQKLSEDLRKDIDSLAAAAVAMDSELKSALERATSLQESFETLTTDMAGLREGEARTGAEVAAREAERDSALAGALASLERERGEFRAYTDRLEAEILSLRGKLSERDRTCTELREAGERMQEQMTRLATELIRPEPQTAAAATPIEPTVAVGAQDENPAAAATVADPVEMPAAPASEAGPAAKPARAARARQPVPPASGPIQIDLLQG